MATRPRRPVGRPSKLTEKAQETICEALRVGCYREAAARAAGIGHTTLYRWLEQGEADEERDEDSPHRAFREAVLAAEAWGEVDAVELIRKAARNPTTWQAAAWLLERKYADRWGRRERHTVESTVVADVEVVHSRAVEVVPSADRREEVARILAEAYGVNGAN